MIEIQEVQPKRQPVKWKRIFLAFFSLAAVVSVASFLLQWSIDRRPPLEANRSASVAAPADPKLGDESEKPVAQAPTAVRNLGNSGAQVSSALDHSDESIFKEISQQIGIRGVVQLMIPTNIIRHIVATIDALPRRQVPIQVFPTAPVPGRLVVTRLNGDDVISVENGSRYTPYVHLLLAIRPDIAFGIYRRYAALFEGAYRALGYPREDFNDRLVEAIDDALASPLPNFPLRVAAPGGMWRYIDEDLEACSAGQKIMLRMGAVNSQAVRIWLREFRGLAATR